MFNLLNVILQSVNRKNATRGVGGAFRENFKFKVERIVKKANMYYIQSKACKYIIFSMTVRCH